MYLNKHGLQTSSNITCFAEAYINIDPIDAIAIGLAEAETEYTKIQTATIMAEYESISKNDGNYEIIQEGVWETIKKWWAQFKAFLKRMWDGIVNFFKELFGSTIETAEKNVKEAVAKNPNAVIDTDIKAQADDLKDNVEKLEKLKDAIVSENPSVVESLKKENQSKSAKKAPTRIPVRDILTVIENIKLGAKRQEVLASDIMKTLEAKAPVEENPNAAKQNQAIFMAAAKFTANSISATKAIEGELKALSAKSKTSVNASTAPASTSIESPKKKVKAVDTTAPYKKEGLVDSTNIIDRYMSLV